MTADDTDPAIVNGYAADTRRRIACAEGNYAPLVIADFDDGLRRRDSERERLRWCNQYRRAYETFKGASDDRE